ncbi:hypothetical protein ACFLQK_02315 [bacterium]
MKIETILKLVLIFAVAVIIGGAARAQEESGEEAPEKVNVEEIFEVVGKMDLGREIIFMWWTDEIWASMAYNDRNSEAMLGYTLTSVMNREYLIFAPISATGGVAPGFDGTPVLKNDRGQKVEAVPVHDSYNAMLPGMIAFPTSDAEGERVFTDETEWLTVAVNYEGDDKTAKYTWHLPLDYPDFVEAAYKWLDGRRNMDPALLSEDEVMFSFLGDSFRMDIGSGLMAAPMPKELFEMFLQNDPEVRDDPIMRKLIEMIISDYTFFLVMTFDMKNDPGRVETLVDGAVAVNAAGETLERDLEAEKTFADADVAGGDEFMTVVFPRIGDERPVKLILTDPETEEKITFTWE